MSDDTTTSTTQIFERKDEAQQEPSQPFNDDLIVDEEAIGNDKPQENTEEASESSDYASAVKVLDEAVSGEGSGLQSNQQDDANVKDSKETLFSGDSSVAESQSYAIVGTENQEGSARKESQPIDAAVGTEKHEGGDVTVGTESQPIDAAVGTEKHEGGNVTVTESQPGDEAVGTESQPIDAAVGTEKHEGGDITVGTESQPMNATVGTEKHEGGDVSVGTESQSGDVSVGTEKHEGGAAVGTEKYEDSSTNSEYSTAKSDLSRQSSLYTSSGDYGSACSQPYGVTVGTESLPGRVSATNSECYVKNGLGRLISFDSSGEYSSAHSQEAPVPVGRLSQQTGATIGTTSQPSISTVNKWQRGYISSTNSEYSYTSCVSRQTSLDSSSGDYGSAHSRETAIVCDSSSQASLHSGVAGDVSNSGNTQNGLSNGTASWEGMAAPIQAGQMPTQVERGDETVGVRNYTECFRHCACLCDCMRPCSRWLQKYKINMLLKIIAGIAAFLTITLGATFKSECPAMPGLPLLIMVMGMALGAIVIIHLDVNCCPIIGRVIFYLIFAILFILDMSLTYTMSPTFEKKDDKDFCSKEFFYFTYYVNFVIIGIIVLVSFVNVPTMARNANDYEEL